MNFNDQNIEMKRTLLEASVGRVSISAHSLETNLKIILFSCLNLPDDEFDKEWDKSRAMGTIITQLKAFNIFSSDEMQVIDSARNTRNSFTHCLSEFYTEKMQSNGSMFELIQKFNTIEREVDSANVIATKKLHQEATKGGVNVVGVQESARKLVDSWEGA